MINESQGRRKHEAKIIFNGKENSGTVHGGNSVDWMYRMRKQKKSCTDNHQRLLRSDKRIL